MISAARLGGVLGMALLATYSTAVARAETVSQLQPYQIVRSLEVVQDRIATGDHAIMPMQRKLLEIIDARLRTSRADDFEDPRNLRALLVYAMTGGNPATVSHVLSRLDLDGGNGEIGAGILNYLNGQTDEARTALAPIDPMSLPADLGSFVALVKGSVSATDDPQGALKLFDQARALAPGALVEEGSLRRSIALAATLGDADRFVLASTQYAASYLRSPYASQFADAFVAGVVTLHDSLSTDSIGGITGMMDAEQARVIYLRIARRAGIDGLNELSAFASAKAEGSGQNEDPRALLYSSLASVSSGTSDEIGAKLEKIDRSKLSRDDRELFDAVAAVSSNLTANPPALTPERVSSTEAQLEPNEADQPQVIEDGTSQARNAEAALPNEPIPQAETAPAPDPAAEVVADTRKKLNHIDELLRGVQ
ncbi:chemotaxis protein MotC [Mesorhizobium sp. KR1-2]|uniref:chemotaxis protein MotC n=1 Tax=Mesorhizobium sp. KR1-2 TaxID=3156609 RepID=UPI0032B420A2